MENLIHKFLFLFVLDIYDSFQELIYKVEALYKNPL